MVVAVAVRWLGGRALETKCKHAGLFEWGIKVVGVGDKVGGRHCCCTKMSTKRMKIRIILLTFGAHALLLLF